MEYKGINIIVVFLIIITIISSFFAGRYLLAKYNFERPFIEEILELDGTNEVQLSNSADKIVIELSVADNINIYQLYYQIKTIADAHLGRGNYEIKLINNNEYLADIYYQLHFLLYEGIASKQFTTMNKEFEEIANAHGLFDYKLWIDMSNIYLMLSDSNQSFYKIIPRHQTGGDSNG